MPNTIGRHHHNPAKRMGTARHLHWQPAHTTAMHSLLEKLDLKHACRDDLKVPRRWNPAWMGPMLDELKNLRETR